MQKKTKMFLIGSVISILVMFPILNAPLEVKLIISIFSLIIYYFTFDKDLRKKYRYYVIGIVIIISAISIDLFYFNYTERNHSGNIFYENSNSAINTGNIFEADNFNFDTIMLPDDDKFYVIQTNYFGNTNLSIDLTLLETNIDYIINCTFDIYYYYDNNIEELKMLAIGNEIILNNTSNHLIGKNIITYISNQYSYEQINYVFKIYIKTDPTESIYSLSAIINFQTNIDEDIYNLKYTYQRISSNYFSGLLYSGSLGYGVTLIKGGNTISVAATVILITYLFIFGLSFIWQKFEIAHLLLIVYVVIGILLLFWYIFWAVTGHYSDMGLNPDTINFWRFWVKDIVDLIIVIIAVFQWAFTVGLVLGIMFLITKAVSAMFMADKMSQVGEMRSSMIRMSERIKQLEGQQR